MKTLLFKFGLFLLLISFLGCNQNKQTNSASKVSEKQNSIRYAKGLAIYKYKGFSIVKVANPWPNANKEYTYILQEKNGIIPDSLKQFTRISVPIRSIIVTSTTHIPSLEMLGVEKSLIGFPNLDYISSTKVRTRIEQGKVKELGQNQILNTELIIDMAPDLIIGYGIDNNNPTLDNLEKSGLKIMLNGDWNEETPLGKAEWIQFFGALYGLEEKANTLFTRIEKDYTKTMQLAKKSKIKPTVLSGAMYQDQWFLPQGNSWASFFIKDAQATYFWKDTRGTGSLALSFETVLDKAKSADIWIGPGQFTSLKEMADANSHFTQFTAFQNKKIYSYSSKKGKTGGVLYYELAPNRPDLVLKDMLKIMHPELLPYYKLYFFEQLK